MAAPHIVNISAADVPVAHTGFQTAYIARANSYGGGWTDSSQSQNDYIEWEVALAAGTWAITLFHVKTNSSGIATFSIDASDVGTIDKYNGSTTYDNIDQITGIAVAADGSYPFRMTMATKNASSSNYRGIIQHINLTRTGA